MDYTTKPTVSGNQPESSPEFWEFRLYVAGQTQRSTFAITNLRHVCETYLQERYHIEIIDLMENPKLAIGDQILAVPTLIRRLPVPLKKLIGDLSDTNAVLAGLDIRPTGTTTRS